MKRTKYEVPYAETVLLYRTKAHLHHKVQMYYAKVTISAFEQPAINAMMSLKEGDRVRADGVLSERYRTAGRDVRINVTTIDKNNDIEL
jgi:hypothetical protein